MFLSNFSRIDGREYMGDFMTDGFAAFIGLDWADAKHDICLQVAGSDQREVKVLQHRPEPHQPVWH